MLPAVAREPRAAKVFGRRRGRAGRWGGRRDRPNGDCKRAGPRRQDADRRASPLRSAVSRRRHDGPGPARGTATEMVAHVLAGGDGQERHCDRDPLDRPAWGLVRKQRRGSARPCPPAQRVRRQDGAGPSRPLRPVCRHRAARRARQPQGDRIRLRHAQRRRHRPIDQYQDKYLGDPSFAPVYEELNRRKAVVYVHPTTPDCCRGLVPGIPPASIEYATDSTRTIAHLVFSGTAMKFPDIRWIFSHSGGTLPFLTGRFIRLAEERKLTTLPDGPLPEFRKFHY